MNESRYRQAEAALFAHAGIDPIERWIDLPSTRTAVRVLEIGEGAPVVYLTGGPMAGATWSYCVAASAGLRCLLVERPGTGLSAPLPAPRGVDEFPGYVTALVRDVLDGLRLERAALVGSSLGGSIALRSAAALGNRIDRVVLAGCPAFVPGWRQPGFFTLLRTPILGRLLLLAPVTEASVRISLRQMGHLRSLLEGRIPRAMLDWERAWQRDTDTLRHDAAMIVRLGSRRDGFDPRLDLTPDDLAQVRTPCLALIGRDDPVGAEPVARRLESLLPDATLELLDDAGHLPWLDDPTRIGTRISRFAAPGQG